MSFETSTHHCAIFHGDDHGANHRGFENCKLHPGHEKFMTVGECLNKKPSEIGLDDDNDMSRVKSRIDCTVRVVAYHVSNDRPDTFIKSQKEYPCVEKRGSCIHIRYGTGYLYNRYSLDVEDPCPCYGCTVLKCQTPNQKSYYFTIDTASHVIFDEREAQNSVLEFFYDSEDRKSVQKVFGVTVLGSRLLRLQTDRCRVVCVTHDGRLAEKLGLLCKQDVSVGTFHMLVSHPHGVSKRISVGDKPKNAYHIIHKTCVKIKKDTKICFPDCHDARSLVQDINRILGKSVLIIFDDVSNTFLLRCDLNIVRPEGVVVDVDIQSILYEKNKTWFNVLTLGTQLVTDNGNTYTFPYKDDKVSGVRIEVFGKTNYFLDKSDKDKHSVFVYLRYNMASCPGSSGARVEPFGWYSFDRPLGQVHFGGSSDYNTSSLSCLHTPDGKLESETNHVDPWVKFMHKIDQRLHYNLITVGGDITLKHCFKAVVDYFSSLFSPTFVVFFLSCILLLSFLMFVNDMMLFSW